MNTESDAAEPAGKNAHDSGDKDACCDPKDIDKLQCKMMGIAKQAEYNGPFTALLDQAKADYELTRKLYRQTRHDAHVKVQNLEHDIKALTEGIRCRIEQERVVRHLDAAFDQVVEQLKKCQPEPGCCCTEDDCDFDLDCRELSYHELVKRIEWYERRTAAAQKCFTDLVGEPAALAARVAACKGQVDAINAALLEDQAKTDLKVVYVQALVAERDICRVWNGFDDVNEFVECLCCALKCWTNGGGAVSKLLGAKAVRDCHRKAEEDHCTRLQGSTVDEIIAIYDKLCADERPCAEDTDGHGDGDHDAADGRREDRDDERDGQRQDRGVRREDRGPGGGGSWYERHGGRER
ncbi:MAG: hypothetical protein ABI563_06080 [Specibacter sp.]